MRLLVAPQEFKGSLTAGEAADAMARGVCAVLPEAVIDKLPLSDGGPGLLSVLLSQIGGERAMVSCRDPLMRPIVTTIGLLRDGTAVVETALASGLGLLAPVERDPLLATTYGTGQLICAALERRAHTMLVGVGGSATVDGGAGAMQALGARLLDRSGSELPPGGGELARLDRIDMSGVDKRLREVRVRVLSDVRNTLTGPEGAAAMFGPQKGATADGVRILESGLRRFAEVVRRDCGIDVANVPGGGAAGGLGAGLMAIAGATIEPGFDVVAEATRLRERIADADIVITGEGRLDAQTPFGKTAAGVALLARERGRPVGMVAGSVDASYVDDGAFDAIEESTKGGLTIEQAMALGAHLVEEAAGRLARRLAGR